MYSVKYDRVSGIIRLCLEGFWDVATAESFAAELLLPLKLAKSERARVLVLSDARNFPVQSAEVSAVFDRIEVETGKLRDRMAMVVGSALVKMQGRRTVAGSSTGFFADIKEAERWLLLD